MRGLRHFLYRAAEALQGWSVLARLERLREMEGWDRGRLERFQCRLLRRLLSHAYRNVPFYRSLWDAAGVGPDDVASAGGLSRLPVVTKSMLIAAGDDALDRGRPKRGFLRQFSSGSTGEPFAYYETRSHYSGSVAGAMLGWTWAGWRPGDRWVRLQYRGRLSATARACDRLFNCLYMPMDAMDEPFMRAFVERAVRFDPVMLRGYAGGTHVFARFLLDAGERRLRPKVVVTTGDTLYPHYREAIEAAFDCPVFDSYGGEGMAIANQCAAGGYHVLPTVLLECRPEAPALPEGRPGRLLVTSLTNTAMPMIRYDIGDLGIAADGPCACGRAWARLKRIVGRDTDVVVTPAGRSLICHHFNNVIRPLSGVEQFQVLQPEADRIVLRLVTNGSYDRRRDERRIVSGLRRLAGPGLDVQVVYPETIPVPPTGKRRYIISAVSGAAAAAPTGAEGT